MGTMKSLKWLQHTIDKSLPHTLTVRRLGGKNKERLQKNKNNLKKCIIINHVQNWQIGILGYIEELYCCTIGYSGVENEVTTFAFPAHGLVVGIVVSSGISNCRELWRVYLSVPHLWVCRYLNSLTVSTWPAPSVTFWGPWAYLCPQYCLLLTYCLQKSSQFQVKLMCFFIKNKKIKNSC